MRAVRPELAPRICHHRAVAVKVVGRVLSLVLLLSVPAGLVASSPARASTSPPYGNAHSNVVPQPDGQPSIFIQANGVVTNSWYANGGWPWYGLAFNTAAAPGTPNTYGFATSRAVAVLQPDGSPSIFFQGVGGSLWNYWYVNGTWDSLEIASSGIESTPVAILQKDGSPTVFAVGPGHSILNYWYIAGTGQWGEGTVAGQGSAYQVPAAVTDPIDGTPELFVEGPDHSLAWYYYCAEYCNGAPSGGWYGTPLGTPSGGSSVYSAPVAVVQPDDTISVFAVGPANSLRNYWINQAPSTGPPGVQVVPAQCQAYVGTSGRCVNTGTVAATGLAFSAPVVTLQPNGLPTVFVLGPDGSLLNFWYNPSQGTWGSGTVQTPGSTVSQVFGPLVQPDGTPKVFWARQDGSLWYSFYTEGSWNSFEWGVSDAPVETYTDSQ